MFRTDVPRVKETWVSRSGDKNVVHPPPTLKGTVPLTPQSFAPFGSVVEDPEYPHVPSRQTQYQEPVSANQGTARKYVNVSAIVNRYHQAPSRQPATVQMTYFACEPRTLDTVVPHQPAYYGDEQLDTSVPHGLFKIDVMERHPYTTQTFAPMGLADTITPAHTKGWPREQDLGTGYVVIVAPTIKTAAGEEIPDVRRLKAFLANGRQAVTYGAGVWHSPMVVVGKEVVGFLVTQWANGVADEDCQELYFETQQLSSGDFVGVVIKGFESHGPTATRL